MTVNTLSRIPEARRTPLDCQLLNNLPTLYKLANSRLRGVDRSPSLRTYFPLVVVSPETPFSHESFGEYIDLLADEADDPAIVTCTLETLSNRMGMRIDHECRLALTRASGGNVPRGRYQLNARSSAILWDKDQNTHLIDTYGFYVQWMKIDQDPSGESRPYQLHMGHTGGVVTT